MFGYGRRLDQMETRLAELETRLIARIDGAESLARAVESSLDRRVQEILSRFEQHPDERVRLMLNSVAEELRQALTQSLQDARQASEIKEAVARLKAEIEKTAEQLTARARGEAAQQKRFKAALNRVYQAEWTGYVSIFFTGGWTDTASLRVGPTNPPQNIVSILNCQNDINSYAGGVVRQGEYWMAESKRGEKSGVECIYTPFL